MINAYRFLPSVPMNKDNFPGKFAGGAFIAAALMLWLGWMLLPSRIGTFFEPSVFAKVHDRFHFWIWMYRVHLFGLITAVVALFALAGLVAPSTARVLVWPGVAVASAGFVVSALAQAFYYHHGAWGSLELAGKSPEQAVAFVEALRVDTEYVTCLTRFGRVFGGLGLLIIAWGALRWKLLPAWVGAGAAAIGIAAMALTMAFPDHLHWYGPVFHVQVLWLLATGLVVFWSGLKLDGAGGGKAA